MANGTKRAGPVAWIMACLVPPAVVGALGQEFVGRHVVLAVAIGVAYEAIVAVGGFVAGVAGKVSARFQERLADWIDGRLWGGGRRFKQQYRKHILAELRHVDNKGLASAGPFRLDHDAVFVDLDLIPRPLQQIAAGILPELGKGDAARHPLGHFLDHSDRVVLAVVGGPGSGKSTLLRHAARQACSLRRSRRNHQGQVRDIPILLRLRDHADAIVADPDIPLAALLRKALGETARDEPQGWFEQQLRNGRCLILLDGLDEVAQQDHRARVSAWAEQQIRQFSASSFVISSRPQGYQSAPVEESDIILQVCGFSVRQVKDFVHGWYQAIRRKEAKLERSGEAEADARAQKDADNLLQHLVQTPTLYDLTVNPLLLTMMVNVHCYRDGVLGDSQADLYAEICRVMLWPRQNAKNLPQQLPGNSKEKVLRSVAFKMMKRRVVDLSRDAILAEIRSPLQRVSSGAIPDAFLAEASSSGLLVERETGQWAFAHKTFQEYLAAAHVRDNGLVQVLVDAVKDPWWAETTLLYTAKSNPDLIVDACLAAESAPAIALALGCTGQNSDIDPALRERVIAIGISAASPEQRQLLSAALLARYMQEARQVHGAAQVCPRPVPDDIYQLFRADTATPEPDAPAAKGGITVGMRDRDAAEFAQWAATVSGRQQEYRLPLAAELDELAAQGCITALPSGRMPKAWVQPDKVSAGTQPTLWRPPDEALFAAFDSVSLVRAVKDDVASSDFTYKRALRLRSRALIRCLILVLKLDLAHVHDRDRALRLARELDRKLPLDRALDRALALDNDPAFFHARGLVSDRALDRTGAFLDIATVLERFVNGHLNLDRDLNSDLSPVHQTIKPLLSPVYGPVLGQAFSVPFTAKGRQGDRPDVWGVNFAMAFIRAAGVDEKEYQSVNSATLAKTLQETVGQLAAGLRAKPHLSKVPSWDSAVAAHLLENAVPVFSRTERVTPEKAVAIRLASLCLAGQADGRKRPDIGNIFRQVAAEITVLELRATHEGRAPEVIMLARDEVLA
jgi:NACHT domain